MRWHSWGVLSRFAPASSPCHPCPSPSSPPSSPSCRIFTLNPHVTLFIPYFHSSNVITGQGSQRRAELRLRRVRRVRRDGERSLRSLRAMPALRLALRAAALALRAQRQHRTAEVPPSAQQGHRRFGRPAAPQQARAAELGEAPLRLQLFAAPLGCRAADEQKLQDQRLAARSAGVAEAREVAATAQGERCW